MFTPTFSTVFSIVRSMALTAGTDPHIHTLSTLHAWVLTTPVWFGTSQFQARILLPDEILRQQQLIVNLKVFHAADECLSTGQVAHIFLWCPSYIQLLEGAGLEEDQMVSTLILYLASFLTAGSFYSQNQSLIHGHGYRVPFSIIDWAWVIGPQ